MQYTIAFLIANVHMKGLCESQGRVDCWSLLLQASRYYYYYYYYYHQYYNSNSVTSHSPNDPGSLPLNSHLACLCLIFLLDVTHADLRHIFPPILYPFTPVSKLISKCTHNSRYIEHPAEDLHFI